MLAVVVVCLFLVAGVAAQGDMSGHWTRTACGVLMRTLFTLPADPRLVLDTRHQQWSPSMQ